MEERPPRPEEMVTGDVPSALAPRSTCPVVCRVFNIFQFIPSYWLKYLDFSDKIIIGCRVNLLARDNSSKSSKISSIIDPQISSESIIADKMSLKDKN